MAKYKRGFTAKEAHPSDERPPALKGRVYNEFKPDTARGSTMPPPTSDTQEPRFSKRLGKPTKGRGR